MRISVGRLFRGFLIYGIAAALPALPQQNQPPNPGGQPGQSRPQPGTQKPGQGNGRPSQGGKPGTQPGGSGRPGNANPGNSKPGNPNPGAGRPGQGNPGRPNPGTQPSRPAPRPPANRPPQNRPPQGPGRPPANRPPSHRPPQWGRPPQNRPNYSFRPDNRDYLRRYYAHRLRLINRARRPHFIVGGYFPYGDIAYLSALPPDVYGQMPPPPPGYQMGYYDGYVVVYDPLTYFIVNVIDLLQ